MRSFTKVDNIKDQGCVTEILNELSSISQISDVKVNVEDRLVSFQCNDEKGRFDVLRILRSFSCSELKMAH